MRKRRHGMGFPGLAALTMLEARQEWPRVHRTGLPGAGDDRLAGVCVWRRRRGRPPSWSRSSEVTGKMLRLRPEMAADGIKLGDKVKGKVLHARYSRYMQQVAEVDPALVAELAEVGGRFTHHSSIAPTGTISLSLANNASNGIEPSFAHHYSRNVIKPGKKSKESVDVYSFELLAYRELVNPAAMPYAEEVGRLPDYFITADDITPTGHVDIQAAAQRWIDSSISKTANVPTDFSVRAVQGYLPYASDSGLKGCTTFRFNPAAFQGVLVKEKDLENTSYEFTLEDGSPSRRRGTRRSNTMASCTPPPTSMTP